MPAPVRESRVLRRMADNVSAVHNMLRSETDQLMTLLLDGAMEYSRALGVIEMAANSNDPYLCRVAREFLNSVK